MAAPVVALGGVRGAPSQTRLQRLGDGRVFLILAAAVPVFAVLLLRVSGWAGQAVLAGGPWVEGDLALFQRANQLTLPPVTQTLFATLNDPGILYFGLTVLLLAVCGVARRAWLAPAALAVGLALSLNQLATREIHHAGPRPRPFVAVPDARTPIQSCASLLMIAQRGADGPTASCTPAEEGSPPPALQGIDWRDIWNQFPSFPSGHMREVAAISTIFAGALPRAIPGLLALNALLAFSRVHLGSHYPSDAVYGALMGVWSGATVLLGIEALRRLALLAHRIPAIARMWDWTFVPRMPGRAELDPLAARMVRLGLLLTGVHLGMLLLGFATTSPSASHIYNILQDVDGRGLYQVTYKFEPALAPGLHAALGPVGFVYALLAVATLASALVARWRTVIPVLLSLGIAVALAFELSWVAGLVFDRLSPIIAQPETPIPPEWRAPWQPGGSFPNRHALVVSALAGVLSGAWLLLAVPAQLLALAASVTAMYFGVAWLSDVFGGILLGNTLAAVARYAVSQLLPAARPPANSASRRPA